MKIYFKVEAKSAQIQNFLLKQDRVSDDRLNITINLQHLETNLHRSSSHVNILNFGKSNGKLHFFGPLSRSVRTLIIKISSSKVPPNTVSIHSVRNVCKLVIFFHLSSQHLSHSVDRLFKNPQQRVQNKKWRRTRIAHCCSNSFR